MATKKSQEHDYNFFVNEETPNYWKFMFFLIRNAFSPSKIILVAVLIALFQAASYIPNFVKESYQGASQHFENKKTLERNEKIASIKGFDVNETSTRLQQIYQTLEKTKIEAEENVKKSSIRVGAKESQLEDINRYYSGLVKKINDDISGVYAGIALAKNPSNINLDNFSEGDISRILKESSMIQGNFYHGYHEYSMFQKAINEAMLLK